MTSHSSQHDLKIRSMRLDEIGMALDWASAEGWNPGLHDALPFFSADPGSFLVGEVDGQPVSLIAATRYGESGGFIGFYIARPQWRGQGLGLAVWEAAMSRLHGRRMGLDGVLEQQHNYRKSGFVLAHRNVRYQGRAQASIAPDQPAGLRLTAIDTVAFQALLDYDRRFFMAERPSFLRPWISQPGTVARALLDDTQGLAGYGVIRPCRSGWKIGPLFSETAAGAEYLFSALQSQIPEGAHLFLDIPDTHDEALALVRRHSMEAMFETARMYRGPAPEISIERTYGITSFELG
jgi:hypothetical protein